VVEGMFQFIDLVFKVVDVQVLRTDSIVDHLVSDRQIRGAGTERQQHHQTSGPHSVLAATARLLLLVLLLSAVMCGRRHRAASNRTDRLQFITANFRPALAAVRRLDPHRRQ